ncbi:ubiquitin thioesterase OTUB1-like [Ruditapes philippinarum]|uniref:ubiquitin thioesterase OTUB1-like n=1 Tax=Ruditapes philippinarum TaxID=129788 RepID=UPI00295BCD8F|nr:ubiquitin thioesterase OTUB1-like [Ruditapes philippinarum]
MTSFRACANSNRKMAEEFVFDPNKNYDEATMAQLREMEKEIVDNQKLISDRVSFDALSEEYAKEDEIYRTKIQQDLKNRYQCVRKTRGDGNCFFRAFGFAYLEKLLNDRTDLERFRDVAKQSKAELVSLGFPEFTIEDFHETFMDVVTKVENRCSLDELLETYNDQGLSDYIVVYLRLLVSGYLQKEADFFGSFVEGGRTMKEFCNQEVEPMGKESDHIHIIALTSSLGVPVRVEYMDRAGTDKCNSHHFPEDSTPLITLLYRPGHYDILYS